MLWALPMKVSGQSREQIGRGRGLFGLSMHERAVTMPPALHIKKARFERMVDSHSTDLFRYALALSRETAAAQDLVQETYLRAWRHLDTLRDPSKAKSWLITTLRREFFREVGRRYPEIDDIDPDSLIGARSSEMPAQDLVREAIFALPDIHRDVLALQVIAGYSGAEISEILGVPRATVNTRLFRARQSLKQALSSAAETRAPVRAATP